METHHNIILIVDDNANNIYAMEKVLTAANRRILTADSGEAAMGILLRQEVDLILLDVQMPVMDGFELAQLIRQRRKMEDVPILFVTAVYKSADFCHHGFEVGGYDYLLKPVDAVVLEKKVALYLLLGNQRRDLERELEERRRIDGQLRQHQEHLTQLVEERTKALLEAKDRAEAAARAKSAFLATMSHEIRSPMNAVIGMTDLVLESNLNNNQREQLNIVLESAQSLLQILNSILDFSKIEAGHMQLDSVEFNLPDLLKSVATTLAVHAFRKGIDLLLDLSPAIPTYLVGDPVRLRQIITNLVGNAIKFTNHGTVTLQVAQEEERSLPQAVGTGWEFSIPLRFSVWDTGLGIPAEKREMIFESFTQADATTTREYGGTGLGLAISRQLVRLMGGEIWVADGKEGRGSVFHFALSAGVGPSCQAMAFFTQTLALPGTRVLVAESHAGLREMIRRTLSMCGCVVTLAENDKVLAKHLSGDAEKLGFDLVLAEERLLKQVMQGHDHPHWLDGIIVLRQHLSSCERLGVESLSKPFLYLDVVNAVNRLMLARQATDAMSLVKVEKKQQSGGLRVMVVDDTPGNRAVAGQLLESRGHQVTMAIHGQEALSLLERDGAFDAILMDVQMPVMNGLTATRVIRRGGMDGVRRDIPIIGVSALAFSEDRQRAMDVGMNGYLTKPFRIKELDEILLSVVQSATDSREEQWAADRLRRVIPVLLDSVAAVHGREEELQEDRCNFLHQARELLTELSQAIQDNDPQRVESHAQLFKEAASKVGAERVKNCAFRVLVEARKESLVAIAALMERLQGEVDQLSIVLTC